jgi:hypothetical protein
VNLFFVPIHSDYCSQREDPFNIKKEKVLLKIAHLKTDAKNNFFVAKKLSNGEKISRCKLRKFEDNNVK